MVADAYAWNTTIFASHLFLFSDAHVSGHPTELSQTVPHFRKRARFDKGRPKFGGSFL